nr:sialidase [uncultured Glaciecola sp.]
MKRSSLIILTTLFTMTAGSVSVFASNETSFIAPLVKESLLLDITNGNTSIIVGERGHILITREGKITDHQSLGLTIDDYKQVNVPTKVTLTGVASFANLAWAVGHDASILGSKDAGATWTLLNSAPELERPLLDIHFFDEKEGIAVGAYGLFYRSLDGGMTWQQEHHPSVLSGEDNDYLESIKDDPPFYLEELSFISPHLNRLHDAGGVLYLAGEAGLVASSLDKGVTWKRLSLNYEGSFFDIATLPSGDILAVGLRGNMFLLNQGEWQSIATCVTTSLNSVLIDGSSVFVVGNNGVVLKLDAKQVNSAQLQAPNSEGCRRNTAISEVPTNFSDAISSAIGIQHAILAVTAGGIKTVDLGE